MARLRYPHLTVMTVLLLLGFTALDLVGDLVAYPFCASDLEPGPPSEAHSGSEEADPGPAGSAPISSDVHIDDCFCCSRCVNDSAVFSHSAGTRVASYELGPPDSFELLLADQLFRPPRLS